MKFEHRNNVRVYNSKTKECNIYFRVLRATAVRSCVWSLLAGRAKQQTGVVIGGGRRIRTRR